MGNNSTARGSDGCNSYSLPLKSYVIAENTQNNVESFAIKFGIGLSTMMFCPEVRGQDSAFLNAMSKVSSGTVEGKILTLKDENNVSLVFEARAL